MATEARDAATSPRAGTPGTPAARVRALQRASAGDLLRTLLDPVAVVRTAGALTSVLLDALIALPRIARTLDQVVPAVHALEELGLLRGTLERLEKLGMFLGEELPEVQHEMETVRRQLGTAGTRTEAVDRQLRETAAAVYALVDVLRTALAGGGPERVTDVLGRVVEPRRPEPRAPGRAG